MTTNFLVGNVSKVEGTRRTLKGNLELKFQMGVNNGYRDTSGTWINKASFRTITVYGDLAENLVETFRIHEKLGVGMRLMIGYETRDDSYTPKNADYKVPKTTLVANFAGPELRWATAEVSKVDKTPADPAEAFNTEPLTAAA